MNFFQKQLQRLLEDERQTIPKLISYLGRTAYVPLSGNRQARVEFVTLIFAEKYEAVKVTILNASEGMVDQMLFRFKDYFSRMPVGGGTSKELPHIWICDDKPSWYVAPDSADFAALSSEVWQYIRLFA